MSLSTYFMWSMSHAWAIGSQATYYMMGTYRLHTSSLADCNNFISTTQVALVCLAGLWWRVHTLIWVCSHHDVCNLSAIGLGLQGLNCGMLSSKNTSCIRPLSPAFPVQDFNHRYQKAATHLGKHTWVCELRILGEYLS